jgi:hypothetical protein
MKTLKCNKNEFLTKLMSSKKLSRCDLSRRKVPSIGRSILSVSPQNEKDRNNSDCPRWRLFRRFFPWPNFTVIRWERKPALQPALSLSFPTAAEKPPSPLRSEIAASATSPPS